MKLLAIVGSPRINGNCNYLTDQALNEAAKLGAQTEKVILSQHRINPCHGHEHCASFKSCQQPDDAEWILEKTYEADGVILATPVYYYNVSAQMKAFIDRNYFAYEHNQKAPARAVGLIIIATSLGIEDTLHTMKQYVNEAFTLQEANLLAVSGFADKPGEVKRNLPLVEDARNLGKKMVEIMKG